MPDRHLTRLELGFLIVLLAASLALRLGALDAFLTTDEAIWRERSANFDAALAQHDWQATYQAGHPGVVTMWLGAVAQRFDWLERSWWPTEEALRQLLRDPAPASGTGMPPLTLGARRLVAIVTWLALLALYALLRRLFSPRGALLALTLGALDPFFLAHSRFHHLDGLLAAFTTLSVVALLAYQFGGRRIGCLGVSAVAAGLAIVNKSPGALLVPWAGIVLLLPPFLSRREPAEARAESGGGGRHDLLTKPAANPTPVPSSRAREVLRGLGALALWGAGAGLVALALWPALWVSPIETVRNVLGVAQHYAETPHEFSSFFWGVARPDPGPFFYPVVWAFRTSPWVLVGLVAVAASWRRLERRGAVALMLVWATLFGAAMTVGEKKFDRYLLPAFPALDIVAAVGWVALAAPLLKRATARTAQWSAAGFAMAVSLTQFALVWPTRPYYISYYNPLLGGAPAASRVLPVGWGEGLDQAAAYLNAQPDADTARVIVWSHQDFVPFFRGQNVGGLEAVPFAEADYYVFYVSEVQRNLAPAAARFLGREQPAFVARLGGLDYVWVFRNTCYDAAARSLLGQIEQQADPASDVLLFDVDAAVARNYSGPLPVRVLPGGAREDYVRTRLQQMVGGAARVWHVTFTNGTPRISAVVDECLAQCGERTAQISAEGMRAVCYDLTPGSRFVPEAPPVALEARFGQQIRLLGYEASAEELAPARTLRVTLYWQATGRVDTSYTVFAQLYDATGRLQAQADSPPAGGEYLTADWTPGALVLDEHELKIPPDAPPGDYTLLVGLYDRTTMQRLEAFDARGQPLADSALVVGGWHVAPPGMP